MGLNSQSFNIQGESAEGAYAHNIVRTHSTAFGEYSASRAYGYGPRAGGSQIVDKQEHPMRRMGFSSLRSEDVNWSK